MDFFFYFCTAKLINFNGMKTKKLIFLSIFLCTVLCSCAQQADKQVVNASTNHYVLIETDYGNMKVKLYNETPQHRDNFLKLVKEGFYDSLLFHRVIQGFMIQGGDPKSKMAPAGAPLGDGNIGYTIPAEFNSKLIHKKGALAAARTGDNVNPQKRSSGSQFYIVQGNLWNPGSFQMLEQRTGKTLTPEQRSVYSSIGGTPFLDGDYTVFGEVVEGLDVIDKIASVKCGPMDRPVDDVRMKMTYLGEE